MSSYGFFAGFEVFNITAGSGDDVIRTGSGNDNIQGGLGTNFLEGGGGDDWIYSISLTDWADGGAGRDIWQGNFSSATQSLKIDINDVVVVQDRTVAVNFENVQGGGGRGEDLITLTRAIAGAFSGGAGADTFVSDILAEMPETFRVNGSSVGLDGAANEFGFQDMEKVILKGGAQNDTFQLAGIFAGSQIELDAGGGIDRLIASFEALPGYSRFVVAADGTVDTLRGSFVGFEHFTIYNGAADDYTVTQSGMDVLYGGGGNDSLLSGGGVDSLFGGPGNDVLDGGTGADVLSGEQGDDVLVVDDPLDRVHEFLNSGNDRVLASTSYRLTMAAHVELLCALNQADATPIDLAGNELNQAVIGSEGANLLEGLGGSDNLYGLGGLDVLDGGSGADTMFGGLGDDWFVIDHVNDQAIELAGEGYDRIFSAINYRLGEGQSIELLMAASPGATTALSFAGNGLNNTILGNEGANTLEGNFGYDRLDGNGGNDTLDGGEQSDFLYGGAGSDIFRFSTALDGSSDLLGDFQSGVDKIHLSRGQFLLAGGTLSASAFVLGTAPQDADDRIIYDQATGRLFYDADGNGAGAAVLFAQLNAGTALLASDIVAY
jgi:Ca2+-binding RTX toxin-like protein